MNAGNDEAREVQENIAGLGSADPVIRGAAATLIYGHGMLLALAVLEQWTKDPELAELLQPARPARPDEAGALPYTVGVAVTLENFEKIRAVNGSPRLAEVPPDQDALEFELRFGPVRLDILTTKAPTPGGRGAIAKFLEKFGEGIQQVEHVVRDVDRATELLRTRMGVQPVYPSTRPGADLTRVNFFLAKTPDGKKVLIELVEKKD